MTIHSGLASNSIPLAKCTYCNIGQASESLKGPPAPNPGGAPLIQNFSISSQKVNVHLASKSPEGVGKHTTPRRNNFLLFHKRGPADELDSCRDISLAASDSAPRGLVKSLTRLSAILFGLSFTAWLAPARATPQLLHDVFVTSGSQSTCLSRAQSALNQLGALGRLTSSHSVAGSNSALSATVYCQDVNTQAFQAIVMLAGESDAGTAQLTYALGVLTSSIQSSGVAAAPAAPGGGTTAMSDGAFRQFMRGLDDSWPDYLDFLAQPVAQNYFTAVQARQVIETLDFPDDELQVALMLYPRVVDPANWFLVEQALSFERSRQELRRQLAQ